MTSSNLILGAGNVGQALNYNFVDCKVLDKDSPDFEGKVKFMHIAFPYSKTYVQDVLGYIKKYNPEIVIIHSTVKLNTTRKIQDKVKTPIVYSPIVGQHNKLSESISIFDKLIGYIHPNLRYAQDVARYFKENGLNPVIKKDPETLELAKLLSTTRYALHISFAQEQERICKRHGLDYADVVLDFEKMFNEGTLRSGQVELVRPFVFPGVIGGHCLMPNLRILKMLYNSEFLDLIGKSNDARKKEI